MKGPVQRIRSPDHRENGEGEEDFSRRFQRHHSGQQADHEVEGQIRLRARDIAIVGRQFRNAREVSEDVDARQVIRVVGEGRDRRNHDRHEGDRDAGEGPDTDSETGRMRVNCQTTSFPL
jgi:hypothetical protein